MWIFSMELTTVIHTHEANTRDEAGKVLAEHIRKNPGLFCSLLEIIGVKEIRHLSQIPSQPKRG